MQLENDSSRVMSASLVRVHFESKKCSLIDHMVDGFSMNNPEWPRKVWVLFNKEIWSSTTPRYYLGEILKLRYHYSRLYCYQNNICIDVCNSIDWLRISCCFDSTERVSCLQYLSAVNYQHFIYSFLWTFYKIDINLWESCNGSLWCY